ncbi:asparagine synthetase domain-containing protein CG17486-like [Anopheles albimanus]|uniref:asparagine synthetase domain-containing protein CG17486-like n=1 Tax=Anopheles albimanus TaxID=7167 RepID=UPI00163FF4CA|nr:asparagine synthetase domain-containing protein CG17486-like [Anopheles albimanus]
MCGTFCYFCKDERLARGHSILEACLPLLSKRGPDAGGQLTCGSRLLFHGSVLWHQGSTVYQQPVETGETVLVFNGDIFQPRDDLEESDTRWLLRQIEACRDENELRHLFGLLRGPFSLIFFRKQDQKLYFARDSIGRNSLLLGRSTELESMFITSVSGSVPPSYTVHELPPCGLYCIDLKEDVNVSLFPWADTSDAKQLFSSLVIKDKIHLNRSQSLSEMQPTYSFHELLLGKDLHSNNVHEQLFQSVEIKSVCEHLLSALRASIKERIVSTTNACKTCLKTGTDACTHPKIGILFSGGIDCTILALLADEYVPSSTPIDLLNVAFEKVCRNPKHSTTSIDWNVPDRLTGRESLEELRLLRPGRKWNFVEINVTRKELNLHRETISQLVYPLKTVLDESLGAAFWFASRGVGCLEEIPYSSLCRVLLLGSGADELFGGYTRHRAAFERTYRSYLKESASDINAIEQAYRALEQELELDWLRLPSRNLARDDRVISDNCVTPRTPYLQEDFLAQVQILKANQRCYHRLEAGIGDKLILRLCAYKLGLTRACGLKKRALQFGSRIADRHQNAKDNSAFLSGAGPA